LHHHHDEFCFLEERVEHILEEVGSELERQHRKWGQQNHMPTEWLAILVEEVGEVSKETTRLISPIVDKFNAAAYRRELLQVAAVAVNAVLCLDRNE
jgi:hypothetical protein